MAKCRRCALTETIGVTAYRVDVFRFSTLGPGDVSALRGALDDGSIDPRHIVAILGKTEGNGGVNDFTREYAHHATASLAIGVAVTRDFLPEELGRSAQITETSRAVTAAVEDAGITDVADVHFVQIKCPLLTAARVEAAKQRGAATVTDEAYASMGYSRGASALGVALALHEVDGPIPDDAVLEHWDLASAVASTSAGIELLRNVVIVMGNALDVPGTLTIAHSVMNDAIDMAGAAEAFAGIAREQIVNVFAKAEPSPDGMIRGARHTMLDDTDISATRHARAAVGGLLAGLAGTASIYVSGGAEHQGPPGGGPIAVIAQAKGDA